MNQQIFLSRRRVTVGCLQTLVLCVKVGHAAVWRYSHSLHSIPPIYWTPGNKGFNDLGQDARQLLLHSVEGQLEQHVDERSSDELLSKNTPIVYVSVSAQDGVHMSV